MTSCVQNDAEIISILFFTILNEAVGSAPQDVKKCHAREFLPIFIYKEDVDVCWEYLALVRRSDTEVKDVAHPLAFQSKVM